VHLKKIKLTNFKNYPSATFEFDDKLNCIVGNNGMGKTNLLDSIYYLCMGKSHFSLPDKNVVLHQEDFFRLEGNFLLNDNKHKLVAKVIPGKKKVIENNDVPYQKLMEHIGLFPVVMIVPDDTRLATEGSEGRRKFLDNALSQLDKEYLLQLVRYHSLLKQRNAALKQFAKSKTFDYKLIKTYSEQMASPAKIIFDKRKVFVENWLPEFLKLYALISGESEQVDCKYVSKLSEADFMYLTEEAEEKDRILARTTVGIHKDDLDFQIEGYPLKKFASQGQLKSFVLAAKLALYEILKSTKKCSPIFLLDDIFDKLDKHRVKHLLKLLIDKEIGQVFISDTHEDRVVEIVKEFDVSHKRFVIGDRSPKTEDGSSL